MKVYSLIYLVKDSFGNVESATCQEPYDCIQICNMKNKKGEPIYFESDARHLWSFCNENDLEYKLIEKEYNFEDLWNNY